MLSKKKRKKTRSWFLTKKKSKFQNFPFFFYKFPPQGTFFHITEHKKGILAVYNVWNACDGIFQSKKVIFAAL